MSLFLRNCISRVAPNMRRTITTNSRKCNKEGVEKATPSPDGQSLRSAYRPNRFEQRMLVWTKKYKSLEAVPSHVSPETMEYCRNKMRIRVANYMAVATVIGCIVMIWSGKKAAQRGENVAKRNLDWHHQYNTVDDDTPKKE